MWEWERMISRTFTYKQEHFHTHTRTVFVYRSGGFEYNLKEPYNYRPFISPCTNLALPPCPSSGGYFGKQRRMHSHTVSKPPLSVCKCARVCGCKESKCSSVSKRLLKCSFHFNTRTLPVCCSRRHSFTHSPFKYFPLSADQGSVS